MKDLTGRNFGLLIAYILPGLVALVALGMAVPAVEAWLTVVASQSSGVTVGGFLYLTLAAVMAGLTVSTIRWAVVDKVHHATGIQRPYWDDSKLQEKLGAFGSVVEDHYRYYQFYGNTVVALALLAAARWLRPAGGAEPLSPPDAGIAALAILYWAGSRDALRRYYSRANALLGRRTESEVANDQWERNDAPRGGGQGKPAESPEPVPQGPGGGFLPECRTPNSDGGSDKRSPRILIQVAGHVVEIRPHGRTRTVLSCGQVGTQILRREYSSARRPPG